MAKPGWLVYLVRCKNGALYTGVTTDIVRRVKQHNEGKGARYTRLNGPVELVYLEPVVNRSSALVREAKIKRLSRRGKLELLAHPRNLASSG